MLIQGSNWEQCCYANWFPNFKNISLDSVLVQVDASVCKYLLEDTTLVLPQEVYSNETQSANEEGQEVREPEDVNAEECLEVKQPSFPEFSQALKDAIDTLGGEVFIKSNWSAPVDAAWITSSKTLKCTSIEDIYLLLKSSDILAREFYSIKQTQFSSCMENYVVVKKWCDIFPGHEFRCFVVNQRLVAISQRDLKSYYEYLLQSKYDIIREVDQFFKEKMKGKFFSDNYVFDIWRKSPNTIKLLDIGPHDENKKSPLLFTWNEILEMGDLNESEVSSPQLRFLGEDPGFQPNPDQYYGLPQDLSNLILSDTSHSAMDQLLEEVNSQDTAAAEETPTEPE